jgi:hypothetical protein
MYKYIYIYIYIHTFCSAHPDKMTQVGRSCYKDGIPKEILGGSFEGKRLIGRAHSRWEDSAQKNALALLHA